MSPAVLDYHRFPPPADAAWFVEHLWVARTDADAPPVLEVFLPNGRPSVLVRLGSLGTRVDPVTGERAADDSGVIGLSVDPHVVRLSPGSWFVGAQLAPYGLAALRPGRLLVGESAPLTHVLAPAAAATLADRVRAAPDDAHATTILGMDLAASVRRRTPAGRLDTLQTAICVIEERRGLVRPIDLAQAANVTLAALHQCFVEEVGLQPVTFLQATRFLMFVAELAGPAPWTAETVLAAMRSYLATEPVPREVERFTGLSPGQLRRAVHGITALLRPAHERGRPVT
ncbi:hypothetical protein QUV83_13380 [Cellulomonas cellasea]|uniref:DUF6597 domain-containing transcriptional factor n=1 Tax=Cellulomonas cellasea TaxID=43670 RepID=UPI0025A49B5B|nr:DUF6597 domain-containing transcriptional factor [Cellulomonas cellasea]MDM8085762.1 hypothetical protein [Cellulomonas cellasea]